MAALVLTGEGAQTYGDSSGGLEDTDLWYLAEPSGGYYEWKQWGWRPYPSGLGNASGIQDPDDTGSVDISAGLLMGPYDGNCDKDFIVNVSAPIYPTWQYTWVLIENNGTKDLYIDYVRASTSATYYNYGETTGVSEFCTSTNNMTFCKILGVCTGTGDVPESTSPRDPMSGFLGQATFPHGSSGFFSFPSVADMGNEDDAIVWCATGSETYKDVYGYTLSGSYYPAQNVRACDSFINRGSSSYGNGRFVLCPDQTLVCIVCVTADTRLSVTGSGQVSLTTQSLTNGWKLFPLVMSYKYFEEP